MAAFLFKCKASVSDPLRQSKRQLAAYFDANENEAYITIEEVEDEGKNERGDGSNANRRLTKQEFHDPLNNLALSFEELHRAMKNEDWELAKAKLKRHVTKRYIKIAEMVDYEKLPHYASEYEDDNEVDDDREYEEEDDEDSQDSKNTKKSEEFKDNDPDDSTNSNSDNDSSSGSSSDSSTDDENEKDEEIGKKGENEDDSQTGKDPTNSNKVGGNNTRDDINAFLNSMGSKGLHISEGKMTGKDIKAVLDLRVTPKLNSNHKNYFYVMQSDNLNKIKEQYNGLDSDMVDEDGEDSISLFSLFAKNLKQLKEAQWQNSIDGLPDGKTLQRDNLILLWKLDENFTKTFFNVAERATPQRTPTTSTTKPDTSSTSKHSTRSGSKPETVTANLSNEFE